VSEPTAIIEVRSPGSAPVRYNVSPRSLSIGRSPDNDIVCDDPRVSRLHARLQVGVDNCTIEDLGSSNKILVAGQPTAHARLAPGDSVAIGDTTLAFRLQPRELSPDATVAVDAFERQSASDVSLEVELARLAGPTFLWVADGEVREQPVPPAGGIIGRDPGADICLPDDSVSRSHARLERAASGYLVRDLDSRNGTHLVGSGPVSTHLLVDGDVVQLGNVRLHFREPSDEAGATLIGAQPVAADRRPVIFIPGLLGSELWRGGRRLWPNVSHLLRHPEDFRLPDAVPLEPRAVVEDVIVVPGVISLGRYSRLKQFLAGSLGYQPDVDLFDFPYDWRRDIRESASLLAGFIERLPVHERPVMVAHSLGSLVARYYVEVLGGAGNVARLIMLGGPHRGGAKAVLAIVAGSGLLPFGLLAEHVRQAFATYPSAYQLLPSYDAVFDESASAIDLVEESGWLSDGDARLFAAARELRQELPSQSSIPAASVFGYGQKTIARLNVRRRGVAWDLIDIVQRQAGDGTVPIASAMLPGSEIHPVRQFHGALFDDMNVKLWLKLQLRT
jgi:pSer/pThr/pTyr-binding forkhead associated (FHA) protein